MSRQAITARLVAVVGEHEANELLETPNFALGGRTPAELIEAGNFRPVEILIRDMEAREASRRDFIRLPQYDVDGIDDPAADPLFDHLPQMRGHGKIKRVLQMLDDLAVEKLRAENHEEKGAHE
jgi:hypothetical protein